MKLRRVLYWTAAVTAGVFVAGYAALSSLQFDDLTRLIQAEVKKATGRDLVVAGPADLEISLSPSVNLQDLSFANAAWGSRAEMVTVRQLEVEVELLALLTGNIVINRLVLVEPDILLETSADGLGNWEFGAPDGSDATAEAANEDGGRGGGSGALSDVNDFAIRGGRLVVKGIAGEETTRLDLTEATGSAPAGSSSRSLTLAGSYNDNPFRVDGTFGSLRDILSGEASPIDLAIDAGGARATVEGSAGDLTGSATAELAVTAEGDSLAGFSGFVGNTLPDLGPYKLSSDISIAGQNIDFSGLAMQLGGSDLAGVGSLDLAGERPKVTAKLASRTLDLTDFSSSGPEESEGPSAPADGAADQAAGPGGRIFSREPLPLEALAAFDGALTLGAAELRVTPRLFLNDVELTAQLTNGNLKVDPMQGRLAGGRLSGSAGLDAGAAPAALDIDLKGEGMDFGSLLQAAEVSDQVGGALALDVVLSGRGQSAHALAAGLDGHVQAVSEDGTIDNALLGFFSAGLSDITGPLFGTSDRANLNCIVGRFDIAGGQAESRALVLDTGTFAIAGQGGIDLEAERVSLSFDTETSEPSLASLAVPFKVFGPMDDPSIVPDPIGAAANVVGTVGTVAETGGNIVGGVVDTLGGLVGTGPIIGRIGSDETLCGEALAAVGLAETTPPSSDSEVKPADGGPKPGSKGLVEDAGDAAKELGRDLKEGIKGLFGN